jgi:hypothetical protein
MERGVLRVGCRVSSGGTSNALIKPFEHHADDEKCVKVARVTALYESGVADSIYE